MRHRQAQLYAYPVATTCGRQVQGALQPAPQRQPQHRHQHPAVLGRMFATRSGLVCARYAISGASLPVRAHYLARPVLSTPLQHHKALPSAMTALVGDTPRHSRRKYRALRCRRQRQRWSRRHHRRLHRPRSVPRASTVLVRTSVRNAPLAILALLPTKIRARSAP